MPSTDALVAPSNRLLQAKYDLVAWVYDLLDYPWERQYRQFPI